MFVKLVSNSYTYTDKVASLVQEAAYLQANLSNQEGDAASIPVSHIDGKHVKMESKLISFNLWNLFFCSLSILSFMFQMS